MPDVPEASGGESAGGASQDEMSVDEGRADVRAEGDAPATAAPPTPGEWWRREPMPPPAGTPAPGTPAPGTPAGGTPPYGSPHVGTPPWAAPPGTPPWAAPPGTPPWAAPPWAAPPWYAWGPGWPVAGSSPPPVPPFGPSGTPKGSGGRLPLSWTIIGAVLGAIAMVAIGLGVGYSVWGAQTTAPARSASPAPASPAPSSPAPSSPAPPSVGRTGFLGVEIAPSVSAPGGTAGTAPTTRPAGAYVVTVVPSSPAAKAGIAKGDTITAFATRPVRSSVTLRLGVLRFSPGTRVKVAWVTASGNHESATVTLASRPATRSIG